MRAILDEGRKRRTKRDTAAPDETARLVQAVKRSADASGKPSGKRQKRT